MWRTHQHSSQRVITKSRKSRVAFYGHLDVFGMDICQKSPRLQTNVILLKGVIVNK